MKTWRLVAGILCIIFSVFVLVQSFAAGILANIQKSGDLGGSAGLFVAICLLAGGITSIATRDKRTTGSKIALIIIFGLAALLALTNAATYKDLTFWGIWCIINAVLALLTKKA